MPGFLGDLEYNEDDILIFIPNYYNNKIRSYCEDFDEIMDS
jgi:hypothetical protein